MPWIAQRAAGLARRAAVFFGARMGVRLERAPKALLASREHELTPTLEHVAAHRMLERDGAFFFVQIGAFDGVSGDPLHLLIARHGWRGVLVEPQPDHFRRLQETYREQPGLTLRQVAVADRRGERTLYTVAPRESHPAWSAQIAAFDRAQVLRHARSMPGLAECVRALQVPCVTLDDLLGEAPDGVVDLLQIDVEGYDAELIRALDLERWRPAIVRFEHKHLSPRDHDAAVARLLEHGYRVSVDPGGDTLGYLSSPPR
jgi:FkbM family methyltransferase